jgi:two-component sensor histidine kinase
MAADAAGVALWSWNIDTGGIGMDSRAYGLWEVPEGDPVTFETLSARIHPEDIGWVGPAFQATLTVAGSFEIDFRIKAGAGTRWISARGRGGDPGIVEGVMFAIFMDVTDRKQAEETRELLAGEMSHRLKNLFAVTSALTALAVRSTSTKAEMASDLMRRIAALGNAHDLARPAPGQRAATPVRLDELLVVLLEPYGNGDGALGRIDVQGPDVRVGEAGGNALALIAHELATNSLKYGALSKQGGTLDISYDIRDVDVVAVWTERGGPETAARAGKAGYGTKLIARSLSGQLAGSISYDWRREGLIATIRMNGIRLAA